MNCLKNDKHGADILIEHLAGTLEPARRAELDRHTESCPDCRRLLEVWNQLDEFPAPAVSPDFDHRLYARIASEARLPWWRKILLPSASLWQPLWRPVLPLAAACAVLVLALVVRDPDAIQGPGPSANDPVKQVSVERFDKAQADQLVQALDDLELLSPVTPDSTGAI